MKRALLRAARAAGGFALADRLTGGSLRILCYHGLWVTPGPAYGNHLFIPPAQFAARMARLRGTGRPVLPLGEAIAALREGRLPHGAVVITIDDGWASTFTDMLPILEAEGLPATVYVTSWYAGHGIPLVNKAADYILRVSPLAAVDLPDWPGLPARRWTLGQPKAIAAACRAAIAAIEAIHTVAARADALCRLSEAAAVPLDWFACRQFHLMSPDEIAAGGARGLDIQLHTHRHHEAIRGVDRLPREIAENRAALTQWGGAGARPLDHFCYPSGAATADAERVLAAQGIASATLTEQGINPPDVHPYRLRRFLDGRSVSDAEFDAYNAGFLEIYARAKQALGRG